MWKRATTVAAVLIAFAAGWWFGARRGEDTAAVAPVPDDVGDGAKSHTGSGAGQLRPEVPQAPPPRKRAAPPDAPVAPAVLPLDDPEHPAGRLRTGRVTLLSQTKHDDYEKATFSFEHGIRDDPGSRITRNDWEIRFGGADVFDVRLVTDDRSTIADLGEFPDLGAVARSASAAADATETRAPVALDHAYLVHSVDSQSDHWSVLRVTELAPGDRVTFEWADWTPPAAVDRGALPLDAATRTDLAILLDGAGVRETAARRAEFGVMADPAELVIQLRTGAQGGNGSTVTLADPGTWSRAARSERELDFSKPPGTNEPAQAFVRGGYVPEGKALVLESAYVFATAAGDSNGHGEAVVAIRGETIVRMRDDGGPALDWFTGRIVIRPGEERLVTVEAANSSEVDVRLRGRFVPLAEAGAVEVVPFWAGPAPAGAMRPGSSSRWEKARSSYLSEPRAVLQVRAGHGGGNPMRVNLLGMTGGYLRKMSESQIAADLSEGSSRDSESVGYLQGGRIPRGKAFVVTRIDYEGRTTSGHGSLSIRLPGTSVVKIGHQDHDDTTSGTWTGRVVVPSGSESTVVVEASWYSFVSATLTGEFEDLPAAR